MQLLDTLLVKDFDVVLLPLRPLEEYHSVFPAVADPAFIALATDPFGLCIDLEVGIFLICGVEDQLRMTKFASDDERLIRRGLSAKTSFHAAIHVILLVFEVTNLDGVGNLRSSILVRLQLRLLLLVPVEKLVVTSMLLSFAAWFKQIFKLALLIYIEGCDSRALELPWVELACDAEAIASIVK